MAINVKGLSGVSVDCVANWDVETSSPDWNIKLDTICISNCVSF